MGCLYIEDSKGTYDRGGNCIGGCIDSWTYIYCDACGGWNIRSRKFRVWRIGHKKYSRTVPVLRIVRTILQLFAWITAFQALFLIEGAFARLIILLIILFFLGKSKSATARRDYEYKFTCRDCNASWIGTWGSARPKNFSYTYSDFPGGVKPFYESHGGGVA